MSEPQPSPGDEGAVEWAERLMPLLARSAAAEGSALAGRHVGICLHVEPKTAVLVRHLLRLGASVTITGNLGTTQPATAQLLREAGAHVVGEHDDDAAQHQRNLDELLARTPDLVLDNGGELIERLATGAPRARTFLGATEETTTGGLRVRALEPQPDFPVVVINDSSLKLLVENEFGVGQSVVQGFMNATNAMVPAARAAVVGYGPCGKGVAETLRHLGARVSVVERDPFRALEALMRGHEVGPLDEVLPRVQLLFLATGARGVIGERELALLADGTVIAGVGHEGLELDHAALEAATAERRSLAAAGQPEDARVLHRLADGRSVVTLHGTRMVNLTAAGGNPVQAMDLGLSLQLLSLAHIARGDAGWRGARPVPEAVDLQLATSLVQLLSATR